MSVCWSTWSKYAQYNSFKVSKCYFISDVVSSHANLLSYAWGWDLPNFLSRNFQIVFIFPSWGQKFLVMHFIWMQNPFFFESGSSRFLVQEFVLPRSPMVCLLGINLAFFKVAFWECLLLNMLYKDSWTEILWLLSWIKQYSLNYLMFMEELFIQII